ncbi:MAG: hypothetical protein K8U03_18655 [Planctomycetia bacterium]|nr:hypothetical protein [Planctomycetia bacterium]
MTGPLYDVCGTVDFSTRGKIELTGADRAVFLHNLCTNDIKNLAAGTGCEAFLLDAKGHIQFYVFVHNTGERLLLEEIGAPAVEVGARLRKHLDKYLIREKVTITDRTNDWAELLIAGANAAEIVGRALAVALPTATLGNTLIPAFGDGAFVARSAQAPEPNYTIFCPREAAADLQAKLVAAGAVACAADVWEAPRIEAGLPLYGLDISDKNLAQELDRNELTISFRKGCYLGQETVARLDALGHVNKTLVVLEYIALAPEPAEPAEVGSGLLFQKQAVGKVTSSSVRQGITVALAYIRRDCNELGTKLESALGAATIVAPIRGERGT